MKLAIVVGHNESGQGAVRADTNESEFVYNSELAELMLDYCHSIGVEGRIFKRVDDADGDGLSDGYYTEVNGVYRQVDLWDADGSVELHFNAHGNATGTETLSSGTRSSLKFAQCVQNRMVDTLGLPDRGVKTRAKGRGATSLVSGRAPAIMVEPFFNKNKRDLRASYSETQRLMLAQAIVDGFVEAFGHFPRRSLADSRTIRAVDRQRTASLVGAGGAGLGLVGAVAKELVGEGDTALEAAQYALQWGDLFGGFALAFGLAAVLAFFYMRYQSSRIEAARIDDHMRQLR